MAGPADEILVPKPDVRFDVARLDVLPVRFLECPDLSFGLGEFSGTRVPRDTERDTQQDD